MRALVGATALSGRQRRIVEVCYGLRLLLRRGRSWCRWIHLRPIQHLQGGPGWLVHFVEAGIGFCAGKAAIPLGPDWS